jgi:Protein of unknown function (DUF4435)
MTGLPRRSMADLITMYSLEPSLADVYVEGATDKALLEYVITDPDINVIDIGVIDIPAELLTAFGFSSGNRQRVIALGIELEKKLDERDRAIRCVIDADFDRFLELSVEQSRFQRMTDFSCIESYWLTETTLEKYKKLGLHDAGPLTAMDLYALLVPVAQELFLLRAAAKSMGLNLAWMDPMSCMAKSGAQVIFNAGEFINRWLNKNSQHEIEEQLVAEVERLRVNVGFDPRNFTHGHDLIALLSWIIKPYARPNVLANPEVVSRMLACCSERQDLLAHSLLAELASLRAPS